MNETIVLPMVLSGLSYLIPFVKCLCFKQREVGLCLLKRGGTTTLLNNVLDMKNKYSLISLDVDQMIIDRLTPQESEQIVKYSQDKDQMSIRALILPKYRQLRDEARKIYKNKKIVYVSSDPHILTHMGLKEKDIVSFIPSQLFLEKILTEVDDTLKAKILDDKNSILNSDFKVYSYSSYEDLTKQFCDKFKLKMRL
jgi:hypothetical protein